MHERISPDELYADLAGPHPPVVIDVRSADDFRAAHIVGAPHIPFDVIEGSRHSLTTDRPIVLY